MAAKNLSMPKQARYQKRGKITTYPSPEVEELYRIGKNNGWDTQAIAKEAIEEAFRQRAEKLKQKADIEL